MSYFGGILLQQLYNAKLSCKPHLIMFSLTIDSILPTTCVWSRLEKIWMPPSGKCCMIKIHVCKCNQTVCETEFDYPVCAVSNTHPTNNVVGCAWRNEHVWVNIVSHLQNSCIMLPWLARVEEPNTWAVSGSCKQKYNTILEILHVC